MAADDVVTTERSLRASDADRERVAAIIQDAAGSGRLTLGEADERLAKVYAARYLAELAPLTPDLPTRGAPAGTEVPARPAPAPRPGPPRWLPSHLPGFVAGYLAMAALLVVIWAATGAGYFWPVWPILGVGVKAFGPRGRRYHGHPHRGW